MSRFGTSQQAGTLHATILVMTPHAPSPRACRNCAELLAGPFCHACGQSVHDGSTTPSLAHFAHDAMHEFSHVDGKLPRTLKALFFKPGLLTLEYWHGHVASWIRPLRLFLVVIALHLLLSGGVGPMNFTARLGTRPDGENEVVIYSADAPKRLVEQQAARSTPVVADAQTTFLERFDHAYNAIRYLSVVLFALVLWAVNFRRQRFVVNHLVASLHFYSFWYSFAIVASLLGRLWWPLTALPLFAVLYLGRMQGRLYQERRLIRWPKTLLLFIALIAIEGGLAAAAAAWVQR